MAARNSSLLRQLSLVCRSIPGTLVMVTALLLVSGLIPVAKVHISKRLLDLFAEGMGNNLADTRVDLAVLVGLQLGVAALAATVTSLSAFYTRSSGEKFKLILTEAILNKLKRVAYPRFEDSEFLDALNLANAQVARSPLQIIESLATMLKGITTVVFMVGAIAGELPWSLAVALASTVPMLLHRRKHAARLFRAERARQEIRRRIAYYVRLLSGRASAAELQVYRARGRMTKKCVRLLRYVLKRDQRLLYLDFKGSMGAHITTSVGFAAVTFSVGHGILEGRFTIGDFALLTGAFASIHAAFGGVLGAISRLHEQRIFVDSYYDFMDTPEQTYPNDNHPRAQGPESASGLDVRFENVSFRYPGTRNLAIRNASFLLDAGRLCAIRGPNGGGKSTLLKLLVGLYRDYDGEISIGGRNIAHCSPEELSALFSVSLQEYQRYDATVRENIAIAAGDTTVHDLDLTSAARDTGLIKLLSQLPNGLSTKIGREFSGGLDLSAGQWKLTGITRAFVRDAPIRLIDEPSASLDVHAARKVFEAIRTMGAPCTSIVVTHRLENVNDFDAVLFVSKGNVTQCRPNADWCVPED